MRLPFLTAVVLSVCLASGAVYGLTFSIDQGPAGSVPPYNDGTLLVYTTQLGPTPDAVSQALVAMPVDALHIGAPVDGLVTGQYDATWNTTNQVNGYQNDVYINTNHRYRNLAVSGCFLFSLDHGDPSPVGIMPDSQEEVRVAVPGLNPGEWITATALGHTMLLFGDSHTAIEQNMGLGPDAAFDDDVDGLDTQNLTGTDRDLIFFSIDDRFTLVPNLAADMRTGDIFVRFSDGGIAKVIDAVVDLGLAHDGDGPLPIFYRNDDIDAMILVNLDDNEANNHIVRASYTPPGAADPITVNVDLGDGILFSLDIAPDLPYANGGISGVHLQPSIPTEHVWLSTYGGLPSLVSVVSHLDLGLSTGTDIPDDIDALALGNEQPVPEPGTLFLVGTAALAMIGAAKRRRMKR